MSILHKLAKTMTQNFTLWQNGGYVKNVSYYNLSNLALA